MCQILLYLPFVGSRGDVVLRNDTGDTLVEGRMIDQQARTRDRFDGNQYRGININGKIFLNNGYQSWFVLDDDL